MKPETYIEKYLLTRTPGKWYPINKLPKIIGLPGISEAERSQVLLPDYYIIIGRLYATFKIVRAKTSIIRDSKTINIAI